MRPPVAPFLFAAVLSLTLPFTLAAGCFTPQKPPCAFSCAAPPHLCPAGYTCGPDGICHGDTNPGECALPGHDGGAGDDGGNDD